MLGDTADLDEQMHTIVLTVDSFAPTTRPRDSPNQRRNRTGDTSEIERYRRRNWTILRPRKRCVVE